jgi:Protein of unknown function (DUF1552)
MTQSKRDLPVFGARTSAVQRRLGRRGVLRGLLALGGIATVPLPILDIMLNENGNAFAAGSALPKRYVTWFFGNGVLPGIWVPAKTGTGTAWDLSTQLQPLAAVKDQLTVITGLEHAFATQVGPHPTGSAASVTGADIKNKTVQLASIDQIVAKQIGAGSPFRSLELGVTPATPNGSETTLHSVSHTGPNAPLKPEFNPQAVWDRIFKTYTPAGSKPDPALAALNGVKASVLDTVLADANDLNSVLGAADKSRLSQHMDGIRALEARLKATANGTAGAACSVPTRPSMTADKNAEAPPAIATVVSQLSTLALSCGLTNVVTYTFSLPAAHAYYRHLGSNMNDDFHDTICHTDAGTDATQTRVNTGVQYTLKCLAEFIGMMNAQKEGAGTVLDNSLVYTTSCIAWGKVHSVKDWPVLLFGKAGGGLSGNRHIRMPGDNLSKVLFTIANQMGCNLTKIGDSGGQVSTGITGLV